MKLACALALLAAWTSPLVAQVGYPPEASPYHDVPFKQEFTVLGGYFGGSVGEARVGPRGGSMVGVRYAIRLGGPADFYGRLTRASSERLVIDPAQPPETRDQRITSIPLYAADVGIALNLTGRKSYHRLMPVVAFGLGVASDLGEKEDAGGFRVGTPFALTVGGGLRYVPGGRFSIRLDVVDYLFKLSYPSSYLVPPSGGGSPVLDADAGTSQWTHHGVFMLGVSYLFSR